MRLASIWVLAVTLASAASAQLVPGSVVSAGQPFPIVADFNGDGLDDLIQDQSVLLNDGTSFAVERPLGLPSAERVTGVLDVNGDGIPDLLTYESLAATPPGFPQTPSGTPRFRLYIADASRAYRTPIDITRGTRPHIADADGDGKDDFLLLNDIRPDGFRTTATEVTVLRSRGDGTFEHLSPFRIAAGFQIVDGDRILSGDLDHDGRNDLVIRCLEDLVILRGTGGGRFAVQNRYLPMAYGWWASRLADVDGDGNLDVILASFRSIRVFFGDGRGNWPRTSTASIAKLHDANVPASLPDLGVDRMNQPRDLAVGHFTRNDRMEIAAGTGEGDLVILAYELRALREVARTPTEFWHLAVRPGTFNASSRTGLYVTGTLYWGEVYPRPRVFHAPAERAATSEPLIPAPGRRRAVGPPASNVTALRIETGGECIDATTTRFAFTREGIFGDAAEGTTRIESVLEGTSMYLRLYAPYALEPVQTALVESNGQYTATPTVLTSCGWKPMTITATVVR
jgi:hypothetical protein